MSDFQREYQRILTTGGKKALIKLLVKMFIPDFENTKDKTVRARYGTLSGVLGVLCNLLLLGCLKAQ